MSAYYSIFRIKFLNGLQYRAAAFSGILTQFVWGVMRILVFYAFYQSDPTAFPMEFSAFCTYIWLQQAFLMLFNSWHFDYEIFDNITNGNVSYELCRPIGIYNNWFAKTISDRLSKVALRFIPVILVAVFINYPFGLMAPKSVLSFIFFVISLILGCVLMVSINMLMYISAFFTLSSTGVRIIIISLLEFLSGAIIPIPFMPDGVKSILVLLPFAGTQNTPFMIYNGAIAGNDIIISIIIQLFWIVLLITIGKLLVKKALKDIVLQGG